MHVSSELRGKKHLQIFFQQLRSFISHENTTPKKGEIEEKFVDCNVCHILNLEKNDITTQLTPRNYSERNLGHCAINQLTRFCLQACRNAAFNPCVLSSPPPSTGVGSVFIGDGNTDDC